MRLRYAAVSQGGMQNQAALPETEPAAWANKVNQVSAAVSPQHTTRNFRAAPHRPPVPAAW